MPEHQFDHLLKAKLSHLTLPMEASDWAEMSARLDTAFDEQVRAKLHALHLTLDDAAWVEMAARLDTVFDAEVRARLAHLRAEGASLDWPVMVALLAGQSFDAALLKRLLSLEVPFDPTDWEKLARQLDDDALVSCIRESLSEWSWPQTESNDWPGLAEQLDVRFDQAVRGKLADLAPEADTLDADWAALERDLTGGTFDQSLRHSLESLALPLVEADWHDLADRLDAPFDEKVRNKLAGTALMTNADAIEHGWQRLVAAMPEPAPVVPLYQSQPWHQRWSRPLTAAALLLLILSAGAVAWWRGPELPRSAAQLAQQMATAPSDPIERDTPSQASNRQNDRATTETSSLTKSAPRTQSTTRLTQAGAVSPLRVRTLALAKIPQVEKRTAAGRERVPAAKANAMPTPVPETEAAPPAPINGLRRQTWSLASPFMPDELSLATLVPPDSRPPEVRLGLVGSSTRTKAELSGPAPAPGYLAGLRLEMIINDRWQVVSGLAYGKRQFDHIYYRIVDEQPYANALEANMELVELPLMIRYHFPTQGNLSLYAQAGIITLFTIRETYHHYDPNDPANKGTYTPVPFRLTPREKVWSLNTYPGNLQLAMGLEYELTNRVSLQLEPFFQQSLQRTKGSGSAGLEKKLYTTGLTFGTMFRLSEPKP